MTFMGSLSICLLIGGVFVLAFVIIGYVLRIDEIVRLINRLKNKLRNRQVNPGGSKNPNT